MRLGKTLIPRKARWVALSMSLLLTLVGLSAVPGTRAAQKVIAIGITPLPTFTRGPTTSAPSVCSVYVQISPSSALET